MKSFINFVKGIVLRGETADPTDNTPGSVWHNSTSGRVKSYVEGAVREVATTDQTQTLTNKTLGASTLAGDINAATHKISNLGDPSSPQDAATKHSQDAGDAATLATAETYTDTQISNSGFVKADGTVPMTGNLDLGRHNLTDVSQIVLTDGVSNDGLITSSAGDVYLLNTAGNNIILNTASSVVTISPTGVDVGSKHITNVTDPSSAQDAATKNYADTGTATLKNKSLEDATTAIVDNIDATKKLKFNMQNNTASTTTVNVNGGNISLDLPGTTDTLVGRNTTDTLTNKTLTSPVITTPTGITKTDVGLANVDNTSDATKNSVIAILQNKSLIDVGTAIIDGSDVTKRILFDAGGTTSTATTIQAVQTANRTITLPDVTDTLVGLTASQTLTNKTLTAPAITSPTGITKTDVGLSAVDNTSDVNKPISTAQAAAIALKSNIASPTFTGSLALSSTTGGITFPSMTTTQRNAISSPASGTIIYNTTTSKLQQYISGVWSDVGSGSGSSTNLISNPNAEVDTSGWVTYIDSVGIPSSSVSAAADFFDISGTGSADFPNNTPVQFMVDPGFGGTLPGGISAGVTYYVRDSSGGFKVSLTRGGAVVDITSSGTTGNLLIFPLTPVTGSGSNGTINLTWTRTTSSPLDGTASFLLTKPSTAGTGIPIAGQGVHYDFSISETYRGKTMQIQFPYKVESGTFADNDIVVAFYDITNSTIVQLSEGDLIKNSTLASDQYARVQIPPTCANGRLMFHSAAMTTTAMTMAIDNVVVGPQLVSKTTLRNPVGTIVYTPSLTSPNGYLYADGSAVSRTTYANLFAAVGTLFGVGDGSTTFNLPDLRGIFLRGAGTNATGATSGAAATLGTYQADQMQGHIHQYTQLVDNAGTGGGSTGLSGASANSFGSLTQNTGSPVNDGTNGSPRTGTETRPANVAMAAHICYDAGNVAISSEVSGRDFYAKATALANITSYVANTPVNLTNVVKDTAGCITTGAAWKYTAKEAGEYEVSITGANLVNVATFSVWVNGVNNDFLGTGNVGWVVSGKTTVTLAVNDYIDVRNDNNGTIASGTHIEIKKKTTGSQQIAATETLSARYYSAAGQSLSAGVQTIINFDTKDWDDHGDVTTGASWKWQPGAAGQFHIDAKVISGNNSWTAGQALVMGIYKNGVEVSNIVEVAQATGTFRITGKCSDKVRLLPTDYLDVRVTQGVTAAVFAYGPAVTISITRIGNY